MNFKKLLSLGATLALLSSSCGGSGGGSEEVSNLASSTASGVREWTVIVLLDGDNNLSDYAEYDIEEMGSVKFNPQVKLRVLADFSKDEALIVESNDETGSLTKEPYGGEPDMANAETLESFIRETMDKYPANKTMLIFWNHGDGWRSDLEEKGAATDDTSDTYLPMNEVVDMLSRLQKDGYQIDLIGFDECLMGSIEVFWDVGQFAQAVVASEAIEPGDGWDYVRFLGKLLSNPSADPYTAGKYAVDAYREYYSGAQGLTLMVLSKEEIDDIVSNINSLALKLNSSNFHEFESARENSYTIPGVSELIDLYSFVSQLDFEEAKNIASIIDRAYKFVSDDNLNGVSIFFPEDDENYASTLVCYYATTPGQVPCFEDKTYYNPFAKNYWDEFLKNYYALQEE